MIHMFDIDHTVVRKTTAEYFVELALKEKIIKFSQVSYLLVDWVKYKTARPNADFIENIVKNLAGIKKSDLERIAQSSFEKKVKKNIFLGSYNLIKEAQKRNELVIFATSSFDFIIKPLEDFFGIRDSIACKMEYSQGLTTGKLEGYSSFGARKKTAAQSWMEKESIKTEDVCFYSDSYSDLPLLEYCGKPVAVNPDRILEKKAKKNGWEICRFKDVLG